MRKINFISNLDQYEKEEFDHEREAWEQWEKEAWEQWEKEEWEKWLRQKESREEEIRG